MPDLSCAAIVLAAGASSRLGQPKQLVQIAGESLLRRTVRLACEAGCVPVIAVLGFEAGRMRAELDGLGAMPVMNDGWRTGMGSSLRCGVASVLALDPGPRNLLLLVCDQIALDVEILRELLRVHGLGKRPVTASRYGGRSGVPAVFSSAFFPELLNVSGDRGARRILDANAGDVACVDFHEGELDLDTPEQLRASGHGEA